MTKHPISTLTITLCAALTCILFSPPSYAEGPLRERLKERVKERLVEKMEERPTPEATATLTEKITKPGEYYFLIPHQELTRLYRLHVPAGYDPAHPTPLVIALHGGGGDMDYMARDEYYGLISKAEKEGFIIIFPNGYSKFRSGKLATWNAGTCCGDARDQQIDDVGFIKKIIQTISAQMNIDTKKVYAIGMSNGGIMAYRLACELPDIFKAVASVTGTDNTSQCHPQQPISTLHIHARNDTHVLFDGGAGPGAFKDETKVTAFTSVPETISRWTKNNQCPGPAQRVLNTQGAYCDLYSDCHGRTQVKLCVTETGGHSWPGGNKPRGETPSRALSANDVIWDFFKNLP